MMKLAKKLLVIFGSVSLMSCASSNNSNEVRKYPPINDTRKKVPSLTFNCNGKKFVVVYVTSDKIQLIDESSNSRFQLDQVVSTSGSKYSDGKIEIHIKGREAVLNQDGNDVSCYLVR